MPRDVSGTYTAPSNSFNPAVDGTDIEPADWNAILLDLVAQGLNVLPTSLLDGDLEIANFNSGTGASATTFWRGDKTWSPAVIGPNSSTDNAAARYDATTGSLLQNSPLLVADTTGSLSRSGNGGIPLQGTNTNDSAAAGYVGELITATAGPTALVTATNTNITSIALTAGDWDITAGFIANGGGTTNMTDLWVSINTVTATNVFTAGQSYRLRGFTQVDPTSASPIGPLRVSLTGNTTYYLNAQSTFTGTAVSVTGIIRARRIR